MQADPPAVGVAFPERPGYRWATMREKAEAPAVPPMLVQVKITLRHADPVVWRLLVLPDTTTLGGLHNAIQTAFGLSDGHLHEFKLFDPEYYAVLSFSSPDAELEESEDERVPTLQTIMAQGVRSFRYIYDLGDDWEHDIEIESAEPNPSGVPRAKLVAGAGACPPEDCGGIGGYEDLLAALSKPKSARGREMADWLGETYGARTWDPNAFDLAETAMKVARIVFKPK